MLSPILITNVHASGCPTTCNLTAQTNVPSTDAPVTVIAKGYPTPQTLNHTYAFTNGTIDWIQVTNTNFTGSSGARYIFKQWTYNGAQWDTNPNMTTFLMIQDYTFHADYEKMLPLTLSFVDATGQPVAPPTSITLTSSLGQTTLTYTSSSVNQYTHHWLDAAVWTVSSVNWQGVQEVLGTQTIDLTSGPVTTAVTVQAYPAKMQLVDGSNHPITGATVTVTLVNGTRTYTFTSDSQGYVDLGLLPPGTYNAHVTYQNQDYGPYSIDPVSSPTYTVTLSTAGGGISTPVVSAFVLLAIFGLALFLIVLAIRVRKPPPPPMIG